MTAMEARDAKYGSKQPEKSEIYRKWTRMNANVLRTPRRGVPTFRSWILAVVGNALRAVRCFRGHESRVVAKWG